jgi:hypothetical protein
MIKILWPFYVMSAAGQAHWVKNLIFMQSPGLLSAATGIRAPRLREMAQTDFHWLFFCKMPQEVPGGFNSEEESI